MPILDGSSLCLAGFSTKRKPWRSFSTTSTAKAIDLGAKQNRLNTQSENGKTRHDWSRSYIVIQKYLSLSYHQFIIIYHLGYSRGISLYNLCYCKLLLYLIFEWHHCNPLLMVQKFIRQSRVPSRLNWNDEDERTTTSSGGTNPGWWRHEIQMDGFQK